MTTNSEPDAARNGLTRALPAQGSLPRDELQAQINIYSETVNIKIFDKEITQIKMVNADDVADIFTRHLDFTSGVLPAGAIWWKQTSAGQVTAVWREPRIWQAALKNKPLEPARRFTIPMPGLLFIGMPNRAPWLFATKERPVRRSDSLYKAPAFNIFANGRTCQGNHRYPDRMEDVPESFFESFFTPEGDTQGRSKGEPRSLEALWEELDGEEEYPMEDLVRVCTVSEAMEIQG